MSSSLRGLRLHITGIVQGVGFRPFVYSLASRHALKGWVRNTSAGVEIEADGKPEALDSFLQAMRTELPPLARMDSFEVAWQEAGGFTAFEIIHSEAVAGAFQPVSPDVCICADCLRELFDPSDRRFRYPFINCTNCGPRFTIITDIPYDRPNTTMAGFPLCPDCAAEYQDPLDRRFHAQPVACPACGPRIWLERSGEERLVVEAGEVIAASQDLLREGKILAVKGLGGFHLACDATDEAAVALLRYRKLRVDKPFALMMADLETVAGHCFIDEAERSLLVSRQRPVVLLRRRPGSPVAAQVAPGQDILGVMLPYTPLHYLLLADRQPVPVLVMTSGNLSEEPISTDNVEARQRLSGLADAFLMHDREIRTRCDDSVLRVFRQPGGTEGQMGSAYILRRSRGYAPDPLQLPFEAMPLLAAGTELKNTFCLTRDRYAFLSHHIGDMENYETLRSFEDGVAHFERLFRIQPQAIAHDLHPDYLSTRYALQRGERDGLPLYPVQHHHAHIAACMAEHGLGTCEKVIGVAFDGTGYGLDGTIWGGEFLVAEYAGFERAGWLEPFPLPGGDAAVKRPSRTALALLWSLGLEWDSSLPPLRDLCSEERLALRLQLERGLNTPKTSSMGRLFDAAASLAGVRQKVNYEAQAAIEFEAAADPDEESAYRFDLRDGRLDPAPLVAALVEDACCGEPLPKISARFHNAVVEATLQMCNAIRRERGIPLVALSGGVWQNMRILRGVVQRLEADGFQALVPRQAPANDGGVALGQAVVALRLLRQT